MMMTCNLNRITTRGAAREEKKERQKKSKLNVFYFWCRKCGCWHISEIKATLKKRRYSFPGKRKKKED